MRVSRKRKMEKYVELSEKERFLKEIFESARLIAEKRELFRKEASIGKCTQGEFSLVIREKGGLKQK